jgi:hypothetical protein
MQKTEIKKLLQVETFYCRQYHLRVTGCALTECKLYPCTK